MPDLCSLSLSLSNLVCGGLWCLRRGSLYQDWDVQHPARWRSVLRGGRGVLRSKKAAREALALGRGCKLQCDFRVGKGTHHTIRLHAAFRGGRGVLENHHHHG
jgi:hypothetical protein